jgi:hypothetical protein
LADDCEVDIHGLDEGCVWPDDVRDDQRTSEIIGSTSPDATIELFADQRGGVNLQYTRHVGERPSGSDLDLGGIGISYSRRF